MIYFGPPLSYFRRFRMIVENGCEQSGCAVAFPFQSIERDQSGKSFERPKSRCVYHAAQISYGFAHLLLYNAPRSAIAVPVPSGHHLAILSFFSLPIVFLRFFGSAVTLTTSINLRGWFNPTTTSSSTIMVWQVGKKSSVTW
jgi:hypothetical protein